jgi:hypothetical protein
MFQHRHYVALAAWIASESSFDEDAKIRFARMLQNDNPRFDMTRFIAAANGTPSNGRDKVK